MNGRNSIKGGDRPCWTMKKDRVLIRENFQEHTWFASPPAPPFPSPSFQLSFFSRIAFYVPPPFFRGPRIFFLPLGRPSAATEGAAKMHRICGVRLRPEKRKKDARTVRRQTRDDLSNVKRRMHLGGKKTDGEQKEDRGSPSSGGNGLRPSLRSQLVALCLWDEIHIHENRFNDADAACG